MSTIIQRNVKVLVRAALVSIALLCSINGINAFSLPFLSSVKSDYRAKLQVEANAFKAQFLNTMHMTESEWQQTLHEGKVLYDTMFAKERESLIKNGTVDPTVKAMAVRLLQSQRISPAAIDVLRGDEGTGLATINSAILIAPDAFQQPVQAIEKEQEAALLHEIMHILNNDALEMFCTRMLIESGDESVDKDKANGIVKQWNLFRERRADLLAGAVDNSYARALVNYYRKRVNAGCISEDSHPQYPERIAYLEKLSQRLQTQQENSIGNKASQLVAWLVNKVRGTQLQTGSLSIG